MQQNQGLELSDLSPTSYVEYKIDEPVGRMSTFEEVNDVYEATDILVTEKEENREEKLWTVLFEMSLFWGLCEGWKVLGS